MIKNFLSFTNKQKLAIAILAALIIGFQFLLFIKNTYISEEDLGKQKTWMHNQKFIDSVATTNKKSKYKIYPFNPNFISDFKGYQLGMSTKEIDRLLAFRKLGKFANSPKEFQQVTKISDSLLQVMQPYFKFPDWVTQKNNSNYKSSYKSNWKEFPKKEAIKVIDINQANKEDLMKISGIGDAISDRIIAYRTSLGGFVDQAQFEEIWGLSTEVVQKMNQYFSISGNSLAKTKIKINDASIKELGEFVYFRYPISKNIVTYRSMNGDIKIEDLAKIKGFPFDKIKIIALYLEF
jgi:DNA uptake protein ComE-like DNA-binding protein